MMSVLCPLKLQVQGLQSSKCFLPNILSSGSLRQLVSELLFSQQSNWVFPVLDLANSISLWFPRSLSTDRRTLLTAFKPSPNKAKDNVSSALFFICLNNLTVGSSSSLRSPEITTRHGVSQKMWGDKSLQIWKNNQWVIINSHSK